MPTELNLPTVGPLPNASKGDDEYTREDIARRVQLTMTSGDVSYSVPLLGHGPQVAFVLSEVSWPIGTECALRLRAEKGLVLSQSDQFNCPKGVVIGSYNATLDSVRQYLVFVRSESSLAHFFLGFDRGSDAGRFNCFAVPEEIVGILEDTGHAYYLTDSRHRTVFVSQAELTITGREEDEILGRNRQKMWWQAEDRSGFLRRLEQSVDVGATGRKLTETVRWIKLRRRRAPEPRWLTTTSVWHTGEDGRFLGDGGVYCDTTELENLRHTEQERERIESMANVVKTFSHQLVSPIVNITSLARNVADGLTPLTEAKRTCRAIAGLAQVALHFYPRLQLLENRLNHPEGKVLFDRVWINILDFLSALHDELDSYAEMRRLALHFEYTHLRGIWLFVDPTLLKQVLLSVLDNAIKYAEETSTISISGELSASLFHIRVRDRGIPLRGQYVDLIFQRGFRSPEAEAVAPGTGHGLWLARSIMKLHGAEIVAEGTDRTTGFTVFDLRFPNKPDMVRKGV